MPEICGIISSSELISEQRTGWLNMRQSLSRSTKSHTESNEQPWAAISVVAHHSNDSADLVHQKDRGSIFALIGSNQLSREDLNSLVDHTKPYSKSDQFFDDMEPPFAACILDTKSRIFKLIGDPYRLLPLYYTVQGNALIFCTKLAPLLKSGLVKWNLDSKALIDLFTYEHVTGDRTLADTVHLLPPATVLKYQNGSLDTQSYCNKIVTNTDYKKISVDQAADIFFDQLSNSVASAVSNRSRIAITLSGGLDSRALLGCAIKYRPDLQTYTFGLPECDDIRYARKLAEVCKVKHTTISIDGSYLPRWLDHGLFVTSGMVSCIHYQVLQLADVLAAEADVVLDGYHGGLRGGNLSWKMLNAPSAEIAINAKYRQRATGWPTIEDRKKLFEADFLRESKYDPKNAIRKYFDKSVNRPFWYGIHLFDLWEYYGRFIQFGPHQLRSFLDVQTPLFSDNLVEFLIGLEAFHLMGKRTFLNMHIKHLPELAKVPDSARGLPLSWPESIRFAKHLYDFARKKLPTPIQYILPGGRESINYAHWFRTVLRAFIEDRLFDSDKIFEGIIKKKTVELIVREHMSQKMDHTAKIGCLLTFSQWYRSIKN